MKAEIRISMKELSDMVRAKMAKTNVEILEIKEDVDWSDEYFLGLVVKVEIPEVE